MPHRILVIGVGSIGERHTRCFLQTGRCDVSICEVNSELRERIAEQYKVSACYENLTAALATPPDAAVICTPANLHIPMAEELAEHGVSLLIEKPLGTSLTGVDRLRQLVAQRSLKVSIAYVLRAHPVLSAMREAVRSQRFGKPLEVVVTSGQHFPFYRPAYKDIYYAHRESGGGAIQDALTHSVNAVEWIVGPVSRLICDAAHLSLPGVDVEDTVHLLTRHESVLGSFSLNQHQAPNESTVTIVCETGTVRFEAHRSRWLSCTQAGDDWTIEKEVPLQRDDIFVNQANAFLDFLEDKVEPLCTLDEGVQTLKTNLTALDSLEQHRWRDIDHG